MQLTKEQIKEIIPYQEPFLFVDGVEEMTDNKISGFYQTSPEDYYFKGHFVDFKIMPGVLVVEALAQLSTILLRKKVGEEHKKYHFLAYDVRSCQFYKPIFPGDKIILKAEALGVYDTPSGSNAFKIAHLKGRAYVVGEAKDEGGVLIARRASVGDDLKCEVRFGVAVVEKEKFR